MLLQYMLYDAFVRPHSWAFAPLNNEARERHWREAIQRVTIFGSLDLEPASTHTRR